MTRPILSLPTLALLLAACAAAVPQRAPLTLILRNTDDSESLRCVLVVAHFVSVDVGLVQPGASREIDFTRVVATGSLIVNAADGREMEVENLLCGADTRWTETRGDVPLLPLRSATAAEMEVTCGLASRLSCTLADP